MIEQMTGKSITELFDWMVGTSTDAILALGMVYGQCQECMYIHNKEGELELQHIYSYMYTNVLRRF